MTGGKPDIRSRCAELVLEHEIKIRQLEEVEKPPVFVNPTDDKIDEMKKGEPNARTVASQDLLGQAWQLSVILRFVPGPDACAQRLDPCLLS